MWPITQPGPLIPAQWSSWRAQVRRLAAGRAWWLSISIRKPDCLGSHLVLSLANSVTGARDPSSLASVYSPSKGGRYSVDLKASLQGYRRSDVCLTPSYCSVCVRHSCHHEPEPSWAAGGYTHTHTHAPHTHSLHTHTRGCLQTHTPVCTHTEPMLPRKMGRKPYTFPAGTRSPS